MFLCFALISEMTLCWLGVLILSLIQPTLKEHILLHVSHNPQFGEKTILREIAIHQGQLLICAFEIR